MCDEASVMDQSHTGESPQPELPAGKMHLACPATSVDAICLQQQ